MEEGERTGDMSSINALKASKKEIRSLMKQKLSTISQDSVNTQSTAVFNKITTLKSYRNAKRIGIYLAMPTGEIQTDPIVRHALESGKQVFVPYLHKPSAPTPDTPRSVMDMVDLRSLSDYDALKRDSWGIPSIDGASVGSREHILEDATKESKALDMILMPGVAFDLNMNGLVRRLGHGKGFYDYFLHRYMQSRGHGGRAQLVDMDVLLYGLALEEQFMSAKTDPSVPAGEHDYPLHGLLLGDGSIVEGEESRHNIS